MMTDTRTQLRALDRTEVPDVWQHVLDLEPAPGPVPPPPVSPIRRLVVAGLALVVFATAGSLAWIAFRPGS